VNVGYRWFDKQKTAPLFPFGFGLSYTKFEYSDLTVHPAEGGGLFIGLKVKNAGKAAGDEVLQVYLGAPEQRPKGADFPMHALAAFDRVHLDAGQVRAIAIQVPPRSLEFWSAAEGKWIKAMGPREVLVGGSSRDLPLKSKVTIP